MTGTATLLPESPPVTIKRREARRPTVISSGFTTVDVRISSNLLASPGGTATNVARALNTLGWDSQLVGTVGADPSGALIRDTLHGEGVGVTFLDLDPEWVTPVLIQVDDRGDHSWKFSCPICGTRFAKHRPSPESAALDLMSRVQAPDVFFFDRLSRYSLALAEAWRLEGTLIVFEPSALGRPQLFERALRSSHIVKYSAARSESFAEQVIQSDAVLVETLGPRGIRSRPARDAEWIERAPNSLRDIVDSAGAGDWTTAGILDELVDGRSPKAGTVDFADLMRSLERGQELGAAACNWEGAFPADAWVSATDSFEQFACPRVIRPVSG